MQRSERKRSLLSKLLFFLVLDGMSVMTPNLTVSDLSALQDKHASKYLISKFNEKFYKDNSSSDRLPPTLMAVIFALIWKMLLLVGILSILRQILDSYSTYAFKWDILTLTPYTVLLWSVNDARLSLDCWLAPIRRGMQACMSLLHTLPSCWSEMWQRLLWEIISPTKRPLLLSTFEVSLWMGSITSLFDWPAIEKMVGHPENQDLLCACYSWVFTQSKGISFLLHPICVLSIRVLVGRTGKHDDYGLRRHWAIFQPNSHRLESSAQSTHVSLLSMATPGLISPRRHLRHAHSNGTQHPHWRHLQTGCPRGNKTEEWENFTHSRNANLNAGKFFFL